MAKVVKNLMGLSESAWVSLAIKSLRMGWPNGIAAAVARLCPSRVKGLLLCGLFEDVFPTRDDIKTCIEQVKAGNWEGVCRWQTHHGRGYTDEFCDLEKEAVAATKDLDQVDRMVGLARALGIYLSSRAMNCLFTWDRLRPERGGTREIDTAPFITMPPAMLDMHTLEGKGPGERRITILSGAYAQHRVIGQLVMEQGWGEIRRRVHDEEIG